ncbi:peptide chain release factor 3 [bacterium]|jgi:peptide chain release factor 3|nr:peptide chain release factor 3 [bacterium]
MALNLEEEINKRRTFGIISHPDAGKTTLTEKLLLFGGAIQIAGAVKAKKKTKHATSDFMEIEKQRGISVASSIMGFCYKNVNINLVDTPGHQDFCEDTYRTLTAVDSVIMVLDSAKGVETQTYKLLDVCRMRNTPVITFINKLDREGHDPIDLLDEIEEKLSISVCPMSWPIGRGKAFQGVYNIFEKQLYLFKPHEKQGASQTAEKIENLSDPRLNEIIGDDAAEELRNDIDLVTGVYPEFNIEDYLSGKVTPIFFGSALNNFGVKELLDCFIQISPAPLARQTVSREITPSEDKFSGFIFKIHANIDPKHRDRIAFLRICSGEFQRNKKILHVRTGKLVRYGSPTAFMAREKSVIETAYAGDIIGLHDTGNLKIGDTLTEGEVLKFKGIPNFSPELFRVVVNLNPLKTKQLEKGLTQLCEEGVAQHFARPYDTKKIVGTVGALQFEVIQYRLKHEYGAECRFDTLNFFKACWITSESEKALYDFVKMHPRQIAEDRDGNTVFLAETQWSLDREISENSEILFKFTSED